MGPWGAFDEGCWAEITDPLFELKGGVLELEGSPEVEGREDGLPGDVLGCCGKLGALLLPAVSLSASLTIAEA